MRIADPKKAAADIFLKRKNSYLVLFVLNLIIAIVRLVVFTQHSLRFHIIFFLAFQLLFIAAWEILLLIHKFLERLLPVDKNPVWRISIQIALTSLLIAYVGEAFLGASVKYYKAEVGGKIHGLVVVKRPSKIDVKARLIITV